jgi:hypothetical protein
MRIPVLIAIGACLGLAGAVHAQSVLVKGPEGRSETVTATDMRTMHRASVTTPYGAKATFTGVVIGELLAEVGAPSDVRLHGSPVNQIIIVTGEDGFTTVLSLAETEKSFRDQPVILADQKNGQPLDAKEGPFRLVIGGELKPARSVWDVIEIELRPVNTGSPMPAVLPH